MQFKEPDYLDFWRDLVLRRRKGSSDAASVFDRREKAESYDASSQRKSHGKSDILLGLVKNNLKPNETVLDVGAGTGRWTIPLARVAAKVTAVEPAGAMMTVLKRNAAEAGVTGKIEFVPSTWEEAEVGTHDIAVCAHAMYLSADLAAFVRKMEVHTRRRCYLALRHFPIDGIIPELATKIHGNPHDSPNFIIAYNALYQMGIYANVSMEETQHQWTDDTIESALARAKRHLHLEGNEAHDELVRKTVEQRLVFRDGIYYWPDRMSSALVWWDVDNKNVNISKE